VRWWHLSRLIPLVCVLARVASGQIQVHFGVEAGVPLTNTLASSSQSSNTVILMGSTNGSSSFFDRYNSETKRFLIGPAFRVEMQSGLGIEVDALYQRIDYDHATRAARSRGVRNSEFRANDREPMAVPFADSIHANAIETEDGGFRGGGAIHFTHSR
jgi:hypothetical protein